MEFTKEELDIEEAEEVTSSILRSDKGLDIDS